MKKSIATMPTGSFRLATVHARGIAFDSKANKESGLTWIFHSQRSNKIIQIYKFFFPLLIFGATSGCGEQGQDSAKNLQEQATNYFCQGQCKEDVRGEAFAENFHVEVEPLGKNSQIFYDLNPMLLKEKPIALNEFVMISGVVKNMDAFTLMNKGIMETDTTGSLLDIVAIPRTVSFDIHRPPIPIVKTRMGSKGKFNLELLSDLKYTLILNPSGALGQSPVHVNVDPKRNEEIIFSLNDNPIRVAGTIAAKDPKIFSGKPQNALEVKLLQGFRLISSVQRVAQNGMFELKVSKSFNVMAEKKPINLVIAPTNAESGLPMVEKKIAAENLSDDFEMGKIYIGPLKKNTALNIRVFGEDDTVINNATVYLSAKIGAGQATIRKQVNDFGFCGFKDIYEGLYDIAVIPPPESRFGMALIKDVEVETQEGITINFKLPSRNTLDASILDPHGEPVKGARIEFSRIGEIGHYASEDIHEDRMFTVTASTNDQGQICHRKFGHNSFKDEDCPSLLLDVGKYLAHIIPPAGKNLSHQWITFDFPEQKKILVRLQKPLTLKGQVLAFDRKTPIKSAFITIYSAKSIFPYRHQILGHAMTDEDGFFTAYIPSFSHPLHSTKVDGPLK